MPKQGRRPRREPDGLLEAFLGGRSLLARVVGRIVPPHDIDDVLQEAFLRSYEAGDKTPIRHPRAFLLRTATNVALNQVQRAENKVTQQIEDFSRLDVYHTAESAESHFETHERFLLFCRAVKTLPARCRHAFILKKVYGLSQREIADFLKIRESTVEKHIAKGLSMCKAYMDAADDAAQERTSSLKKTEKGRG